MVSTTTTELTQLKENLTISDLDEDTFILLAGRKGLFRLSLRTRQRSIR